MMISTFDNYQIMIKDMTTGKVLDWLIRGIIALSVAIIGFLLRDLYQTQTSFNNSVSEKLYNVEIFMAKTEATRFTSIDWLKSSQPIIDTVNQADKRLTRTEDSITSLRNQLDRIEQKIDKQIQFK